jgi:hypothetical protein
VSLDRSAPLFGHLFSVTWSLHLLYEEIKLNKVFMYTRKEFKIEHELVK